MKLVEGIYQKNPFADYFNEILSKTLSSYIKHKLQADQEYKIHILEMSKKQFFKQRKRKT